MQESSNLVLLSTIAPTNITGLGEVNTTKFLLHMYLEFQA